MFTGIIQHLAKIILCEFRGKTLKLGIETQFANLIEGESIAVDGVCLTVINPQISYFECELSPETLSLTTFAFIKIGSYVNLERSLTLTDTLGGHFVYGHVDKKIWVKKVNRYEAFQEIIFAGIEQNERAYIVKKGSIAINGVSLTINQVFEDGFSVMMIPHTLEKTNLGFLAEGDAVNIEFDHLVRIIVNRIQLLEHQEKS